MLKQGKQVWVSESFAAAVQLMYCCAPMVLNDTD
jgi:hypothetical protein